MVMAAEKAAQRIPVYCAIVLVELRLHGGR
jgi:hypothetical protein